MFHFSQEEVDIAKDKNFAYSHSQEGTSVLLIWLKAVFRGLCFIPK